MGDGATMEGEVEFAAKLIHELDTDGKQLQSLLYAAGVNRETK
jgi:hypothetical protein